MSAVPARPERAVRVLHTSDWHLGVAVANEARTADHDAVLDEIVTISAAAAPDLIVHTGDLFNTSRPAMSEFGRAIEVLRRLGEIAPVLVLSGNHDSVEAMAALGVAVSDPVPAMVDAGAYDKARPHGAKVRVHHRPSRPDDGAVMTYPTRAGGALRVASLPFIAVNRFVSDFDDLVNPTETYVDNLRKIHDLLAAKTRERFDPATDVAVFASHLFVSGSNTSSEKEIHVGDHYATDPAHLPDVYGYLAFGHIHVPQNVGANGRYAGSILEVDFGETGEQKRVLVVDLEPGRPAEIRDVWLTAGRRLRRVSAPLSQLPALADELGNAIVEVTVVAEHPNNSSATDSANAAGDNGSPTGEDLDGVAEADNAGDEPDAAADEAGGDEGSDEADQYSLAGRVRAALPDATVVRIIDLRNPAGVLAAALGPGDGGTSEERSVADEYREWLAGPGRSVVAAATGDHAPDLELAVTLLTAAVDAATDGTTIDAAALDGLVATHEGATRTDDADSERTNDAA